MNGLHQLLSTELAYRLGWTLVHSLWQGAAVAGLFGLSLLIIPKAKANARYLAGCISLLAILAACVVTFTVVRPPKVIEPAIPVVVEQGPVASVSPRGLPTPTFDTVKALPEVPRRTAVVPPRPWRERLMNSARTMLTPVLPWLAGFWLAGVAILSLWRCGGVIATYRLRRIATSPVAEQIGGQVRQLAARLRISRPVRALQSAVIVTPAVIGHLRPVILLPVSALTGLSSQELEAIIAHEMAHIRRHDYLINILQTVIDTLMFHHPAVWWISRCIRAEREHCCDDVALAVCGDRLTYARALAQVEQLGARNTSLAAAASGGSLLGRIRRIAGPPPKYERAFHWSAGALSILLAGAFVFVSCRRLADARETQTPSARTSALETDRSSTAPAAAPEDGLQELARISAARAKAIEGLRNLHIVSTCRLLERNAQTNQWETTPVLTHTRAWYERLRNASRMRVDFDPEIAKWVGGAAPYCENRYTVTWNGEEFVKIDHIYNDKEQVYSSRVTQMQADWPRQVFERLLDGRHTNLWGTGTAVLIGRGIGDWEEIIQLPVEDRKRVQIDVRAEPLAANEGSPRRITIEAPGGREIYVVDPARDNAIVSYVNEVPTTSPRVPKVISRLEVKGWKKLAAGVWFPTHYEFEASWGKLVYDAEEVGFYAPGDADTIFNTEDIPLGKLSKQPPAGFVAERTEPTQAARLATSDEEERQPARGADTQPAASRPSTQSAHADYIDPRLLMVAIEMKLATVSAGADQILEHKYPTLQNLGYQAKQLGALELRQTNELLTELASVSEGIKDLPRVVTFDGRPAHIRDRSPGHHVEVTPTVSKDRKQVTLKLDVGVMARLNESGATIEETANGKGEVTLADRAWVLLRIPLQRSRLRPRKSTDPLASTSQPEELVREAMPEQSLGKFIYVVLKATVVVPDEPEQGTSSESRPSVSQSPSRAVERAAIASPSSAPASPRARVYCIQGEVLRPGHYSAERPVTLLQAVAAADGFKPQLPKRKTTCDVSRLAGDKPMRCIVDLDSIVAGESADVEIKPDDLLTIAYDGKAATDWREELIDSEPNTPFMAVARERGLRGLYDMAGEIRFPGPYSLGGEDLRPGGALSLTSKTTYAMTLRRAIALAGGIGEQAQGKPLSCELERRFDPANQRRIVISDLNAVLAGTQPDVEILPNDVIRIHKPGAGRTPQRETRAAVPANPGTQPASEWFVKPVATMPAGGATRDADVSPIVPVLSPAQARLSVQPTASLEATEPTVAYVHNGHVRLRSGRRRIEAEAITLHAKSDGGETTTMVFDADRGLVRVRYGGNQLTGSRCEWSPSKGVVATAGLVVNLQNLLEPLDLK